MGDPFLLRRDLPLAGAFAPHSPDAECLCLIYGEDVGGIFPSTESFGEGDGWLWRRRHVGGRDVACWASTILHVLALENWPVKRAKQPHYRMS